MPDLFSQRVALAGPPVGILLREEVPKSFRMFLTDLPIAGVGVSNEDMRTVVCKILQVWPDDNASPYYDSQQHIRSCDWFRIYDIIEALYAALSGKREFAFQ